MPKVINQAVLRSQACFVAGVALGWRWLAQRAGSLDPGSFLLFQSTQGENTIPRAALCVPGSRGERKAGLPAVTVRMVPGRCCRGSPGWPRGCCQAAASVPGHQQTLRGGRTSREMLNRWRGPVGSCLRAVGHQDRSIRAAPAGIPEPSTVLASPAALRGWMAGKINQKTDLPSLNCLKSVLTKSFLGLIFIFPSRAECRI